jgi:diaminohydroxyphosphoribosylaminopyrimidine deaminase/5-amino-6-(5-phosphoribosylamino)uracil reductase
VPCPAAPPRPEGIAPRGDRVSGRGPPDMSHSSDVHAMQRALELAARGRGRTRPNPPVGAVVTRGGRIVGEGWHEGPGRPHAEAVALAQAGARARGATLYASLEPCDHAGRTPPCTGAILAAGIARCVVAMRDPHRIVDGRGLRRLRAAGLEVALGVLGREAAELLGGYVSTHRRGLPRVTWKVAATLDGRIADARGASRWITGEEARARGHALRATSDAIVVGAGTARADDPRLTVRHGAAGGTPLRVVCDTRLALPPTLKLFSRALAAGTVVACGPKAPAARERALAARGVRVWRLPLADGAVSPEAVARSLAGEGCHEVLLEGGATLGTAWWRAGLIGRVALFQAPAVLGGDGMAWLGRLGGVPLTRAPRGRVIARECLGDDTLLHVAFDRAAHRRA